MQRLRYLGRVAGLASVILLALAPGAPADNGPARDDSTILVKFTLPHEGRARVEALGDEVLAETRTRVEVVRIRAGASVEARIAQYTRRPDVLYAEPNYIANALLAAPNDPSFGSQWAFGTISAVAGWSIYPGAYAGSGGATLAVVDTGVASDHPDLGDGRVLTGSGANCLIGSCSASSALDDNGHGTHVAGIAAAATNNLTGVAGTAFSSAILPVKVLNSLGSGSYASVASGIVWAADHGARAINLSLGGSAFSQTLCDAVTYALSRGALVVAAAGNSSTSSPSYPAACSGAVGVAATDSTDNRATFSNFGYPDVFVSAPGVSIFSTYLNGSYATLSGTSMATPFVTGLAALLFGQVPTRAVGDVKTLLATTSDKVGAGSYGLDPFGTCAGCTWNASFGYGRIDVAQALAAASPPPPTPDFTLSASPSSVSTVQGGSVSYTVSVGAQNGFAGDVALSLGGLPSGATATFAPGSVAAPGSSQLAVATASTTPAGSYPLTITGTSGSISHTTSATLVVNPAPDFGLTVSPSSKSVRQGRATSYTVSVSSQGGFADAVSLSVTGLPGGATATFTPSSVVAPGSSTMKVRTANSTPLGTYTLTVTGTAGAISHTATASLTVK